MTRLFRIACAVAVLAGASGCSGVRVYDGTSEIDYISGIPFYIKTPVRVHETTWLETDWKVQFSIALNDDPNSAIKYPADGDVLVSCVDRSLLKTTAREIVDLARKETTLEGARLAIASAINRLERLEKSRVRNADGTSKSEASCADLVGNTVKTEMRVSDTPYYIKNVIPLFGSGSATFKFNADGTLTEATNSITDNTGSTLLGLFPIKEKLISQWKVKTTDADANILGSPTGQAKVPVLINVVVTITPSSKTHVLRRECALVGTSREKPPADAKSESGPANNQPQSPQANSPRQCVPVSSSKNPFAPLALDDGKNGKNGVQLISSGEPSDKPAEKADPKSFKIQGSITPPDTTAE